MPRGRKPRVRKMVDISRFEEYKPAKRLAESFVSVQKGCFYFSATLTKKIPRKFKACEIKYLKEDGKLLVAFVFREEESENSIRLNKSACGARLYVRGFIKQFGLYG